MGKNLTTSEIIEQGSVKFATFLSYIRASGGVFIFSCTVFAMFLNVGSSAFSSWWLAHWIKTGMGDGITNEENVTKIMV